MTSKSESKYHIIANWVRERAESGDLKAGDKLPSENELAEQFDMSRQTVRHAIDVLEREGLITRKKGSGTYLGTAVRKRVKARHRNIAIVSTYMDSYIFPAVFRGLDSVLSAHDYTMQVAITGNRGQREIDILRNIINYDNVDALIIEPSRSAQPCVYLDLYREIEKSGIPIIFFNCERPELGFPLVAMDDRKIGFEAAKYLISKGHKELGGIFKCDDRQGQLRYAGFLEGAQKKNLQIPGRHVLWTDTDGMNEVADWSDYMFDRLAGCTGIFCYNDELAYHFAEICRARGIRIPDDISVIGVDHQEPIPEFGLRITSFQYPREALGEKVAENAIQLIENPHFDAKYLFEPEFVELDSVKRLY